MKLCHPTIILFMGLAFFCLLGCHEKSSATSQPNKIGTHTKEVKPGAAVKLISSPIISINANELVQIELLLDVKESSGTLSLEFSPTNGLSLLDTNALQNFHFSQATTINIPVKVRANSNGRYYLNIHVSIDNGDSLSTRNLALIVQVGAEVEKSTQLKKMSNENVISMPAQETISNP